MGEPRAYPFGLDADRRLALSATCRRSHDGQWSLKAAAGVGLDEAIRAAVAGGRACGAPAARDRRDAPPPGGWGGVGGGGGRE